MIEMRMVMTMTVKNDECDDDIKNDDDGDCVDVERILMHCLCMHANTILFVLICCYASHFIVLLAACMLPILLALSFYLPLHESS